MADGNLPKIKVAGVPEHFNTPWHLAIEQGTFRKHGVEVEFVEQKLGTGALLSMLKKGEVDLVVALTEGLVADICQGSDVKLLGTYVESPLCWAITSGKNSSINSVEDLRGKKFGISRFGSGSHLMAFVLGLQRGWDLQQDLHFEVKGNFEQLRASVNDGSTDAFMWETFMTKPYHDSGEVKRVGDITTPWPCFMLASRVGTINEKENAIKAVTLGIKEACETFHADPAMPQRVAEKFGHKLEDSEKWYQGVHITGTGDISEAALDKAISILRTVKVIPENNIGVTDLIDARFAHLRHDIKSMHLYKKPELINYIYSEMAAAGLSKGPLKYTDLIPFDEHHHYHGVEAVELCASKSNINSKSRVIHLGSGLGGPARYLAGKYGCQVLAVELQHDLTSTAYELTERCGLTHLVHHVAGNFLQIAQHLQAAHYDCVISWLTVLHIPDRKQLFSLCDKILVPGGKFYAEDFYELNSLSQSDRDILQNRVFCSYLPSLARYKQDMEKSGLSVTEIDELTKDWTDWTKNRTTNWENSKERLAGVLGNETYSGLSSFYKDISSLFQAGNLGGLRIVGQKPQKPQ